jgi:DNA-binding response OmpR family regulator
MDGISLLSEISNRFSASRPIVSLFVTAHSSLQVATQAMQYHATDLLTKPVSLENLAAALRRASAKHVTMSNRFEITARTKRLAPSVGRDLVPKCDAAPTGSELQSFIKMLLKFQHYKFKFFDPAVLSGPSWEILLDITEASLRGEAIPASAASATALVPLSTALRHVLIIVSQKDTLNFRSGFICQRQEHPTLINGVIVTLNNIAFSQYSDVPQRSRYRRKRGMAGA